MGSKPALVLLTALSPLVTMGLIIEARAAFWLMVPMVCALPGLLIVVGSRPGRVPTSFLLLLWVLLTGSWFGLGWLSSHVDLQQPSVGHAVQVLALMLVGLGLAPLLLVGLTFALTFRGHGRSTEGPPSGSGGDVA